MIIFENSGEIDPQAIALIGINVKSHGSSPIGFFGTGLKYAVACAARWEEGLVIQSGLAEFHFTAEPAIIRGVPFQVILMNSKINSLRLGFTTELGKHWEPWMVYRELWCNAHDEAGARVYEAEAIPAPRAGLTRVIAPGLKLAAAHATRRTFLLDPSPPLHTADGLEIHSGPSLVIFYRGIAVRSLSKPSLFTYNITEHLYLTEDRTAGSWATDSIIVRGLATMRANAVIDKTILAPGDSFEAGLDYDYAGSPSPEWLDRAKVVTALAPLHVPKSIREKFQPKAAGPKLCPTCGKPLDEPEAETEA